MRSPLANLDRSERIAAIGGFLTLFGILAGHTLTETARDAMFLAKLPAHDLATVYLAIAAFSVVLLPIEQRVQRRFGGAVGLSMILLAGAAMLVFFHGLARTGHHYTFIALYVYSSLFATLVTVHFWLVVGFKYSLADAKRVFGWIGAGAVVGAVVGAAVARAFTQYLPARELLLPAAGFMALSAIGPVVALRTTRAQRTTRRAHTLFEDLPLLRDDPYLRRVALLVVASAVVFTLTDYAFKSVVSQHVPKGDLGKFFATTYTALNIVALIAQLGAVTLVVRKAGVTRALAVLPILLLLGGAGLVAGGGLVAVLIIKGGDGGLRHSLHRTGVELLYLPIAEKIRTRLKSLIDGFGQRAGQAVGSMLILAIVRFGHDSEIWLGVAIAGVAAAWLLGVRGLRRHYLDMFRETLARGAPSGKLELPALDLRSLSTLIASLNSPDDREVLATLDLLGAQKRVDLVPALILYHPSSAIVLAALALLAESKRRDHLPLLARLVKSDDPAIRAAAISARVALEPGSDIVVTALRDESPIVRATALVELVATRHQLAEPELLRAADELPKWSEDAVLALVRGIRRHPGPAFIPVLATLGRSRRSAIENEVAEAMAELGAPEFVSVLLPMLGDPATRAAARRALIRIGMPALEALVHALGDPSAPIAIRRHVPRTISRFPARQAIPILVSELPHATGMVRFKLLSGLGGAVRESPDVEFDRDIVEQMISATLAAAQDLERLRRDFDRSAELEPKRVTPMQTLVSLLLADKYALAIERVFRLLGVLDPREDFEHIYRGLSSPDQAAQSSSRELIEHVVPPEHQATVLALVHRRDKEPARVAPPPPYAELLGEMLRYPSTSLRALVAAHAGELGLAELRKEIVAARPDGEGALAAVFARALERLDRVSQEEVPRAG